jgi:hypothetical protein
MQLRRFALPSLLLLALACSGNTAGRPAGITQPKIDVSIANEIFFGSGSTAPATIDIRVTNTSPQAITVRRVDVESPGMTEWGLPKQSHVYNETIAPGETRPITFFATARTITSRRSEPLSYQTRIEFEAAGQRWQEFVRVFGTRPPL